MIHITIVHYLVVSFIFTDTIVPFDIVLFRCRDAVYPMRVVDLQRSDTMRVYQRTHAERASDHRDLFTSAKDRSAR